MHRTRLARPQCAPTLQRNTQMITDPAQPDNRSLLALAVRLWDAGLTPMPHVAGVEEPSYLDASGVVRPIAWGRYKDAPPDRGIIERWFQHGDLDTLRLEILTGSCPPSKY